MAFLHMVSRDEWRALPPQGDMVLVSHPVENVIYNHSLDVPVCMTDEECVARVQQLQKQHMDEGKPDINYNFLIGGNGKIYEGRGWWNQTDGDLMFPEYNGNRIDIAYIGNYIKPENIPLELQCYGIKLAELGVDMCYVEYDYNSIPKDCGIC